MVRRVDSLLDELSARHGAGPEFMRELRPMVERILDSGTPEAARPHLLELVAETCERHVTIRRDTASLRTALERLFASVQTLLLRAGQRPPPREEAD